MFHVSLVVEAVMQAAHVRVTCVIPDIVSFRVVILSDHFAFFGVHSSSSRWREKKSSWINS